MVFEHYAVSAAAVYPDVCLHEDSAGDLDPGRQAVCLQLLEHPLCEWITHLVYYSWSEFEVEMIGVCLCHWYYKSLM